MRAPARPRLLPTLLFVLLVYALVGGTVWSLRRLVPSLEVRRMLVDVASGDDESAFEASQRIRALGNGVLPVLVECLPDHNLVFRKRLVQLIGDLRDPAARPVLEEYLTNEDDYVRHECVIALAKLDPRATYPALVRALLDPAPRVRLQAARALGEGVPQEALPGLLHALYRCEPQVRTELAETIRRRFALEELVPHLVRSIREGPRAEKESALALLGEWLRDDVATTDAAARMLAPPLEEVARSGDPALSYDALQALSKVDRVRAAAIALSTAQEASLPDDTRALALRMLSDLKPAGAIDAVLSAIRCGRPAVEMQARDALESVAAPADATRIAACLTAGDFPPEAQETFLHVLSQVGTATVVPALLAIVADPSAPLSEPAQHALLAISGRDGAATVPHLVAGLDAQSDASFGLVTRMLVDATGYDPTLGDEHALDHALGLRRGSEAAGWKAWWEKHGPEAPSAWRDLGERDATSFLSNANPVVRQRALQHLDHIQSAGVVRAGLTLLNDPDEYVSGTAADLLSRNPSEEVRETLAHRLTSDEETACRAARLIARMPHASLVEPLIAALGRPEASVRERATEALGGTMDDRAVPRLLDMLFDSSREVREAAAAALAQFKDTRMSPRIVEGLNDGRPDVRRSCAILLARIGDKSAIPRLIPLTGDNMRSVRANASAALEELTGQRFNFAERTPGAVMREAWEKWWKENGAGAEKR